MKSLLIEGERETFQKSDDYSIEFFVKDSILNNNKTLSNISLIHNITES
jgi:hypothetical protein